MSINTYFSRVYKAVGLLLAVLVMGVGGYIWLEGYSFIEAVYMTVITVGTVGFGEVRPLSDAGRMFTSFLILASFVSFTYGISVITAFIFDGEATRLLKIYRLEQEINKLENHVVVCGYGRIGRQVCEELENEGQAYVVIETNENIIQALRERPHVLTLFGDSTEDDILRRAGISRARALIATLPNDANNVFVVLTARELNAHITIISRASNESTVSKLQRAGCDHVILPERLGGAHMAELVLKPDVIEFLRLITSSSDQRFFFEEYIFSLYRLPNASPTVENIEQHLLNGARIIGLKLPDGQFIINPPQELIVADQTKLIILGAMEQIRACKVA